MSRREPVKTGSDRSRDVNRDLERAFKRARAKRTLHIVQDEARRAHEALAREQARRRAEWSGGAA